MYISLNQEKHLATDKKISITFQGLHKEVLNHEVSIHLRVRNQNKFILKIRHVLTCAHKTPLDYTP